MATGQITIFTSSARLNPFQIADYWAQEDNRTYPSATHIDFVLSLAQLFGKPVLEAIKPIVEGYLSVMDSQKVYDRHKMRALWEFLAGLLRGSEEWPGRDRADFWAWFTPKLPELFNNIRHDTTKSVLLYFLSKADYLLTWRARCWDIAIEYVLNDQDPRRFKPLIDFCMDIALSADFNAGSAFDRTFGRRVDGHCGADGPCSRTTGAGCPIRHSMSTVALQRLVR